MWLHSPGSSHFMLTSIIEACKVDQDLTDIIFSEYKVALSRKRALVTQLDQSPLKDVSVIKNNVIYMMTIICLLDLVFVHY